MTLCNDGHEEVCYEGRYCPACQAKDEVREADKELSAALAKIEKLGEEIDQLEEMLREMRSA